MRIQLNTSGINWDRVVEILQKVEMASYTAEIHQTAFNNSQVVVFIFDTDTLIGFGRAITDGAYQAAVYDVAVWPEYQGKGVGWLILNTILEYCPNCNVILYATPGKETFYEKHSFRKMKTGMALFTDPGRMIEKGFIK
ncbi:MAG: GNAT family N-acetyltransferase [Paludibacter sp.]|nr:GNAT family N-acetyltransferase [Paludibacter sp.]